MARSATGFATILSSRRTLPPCSSSLLMGERMVLKMYVHCDNEAVVQCVNEGRSHSPALSPFLRRLKWIVACDQFVIVPRYVAGSENQIADSLSRFLFQKFRRLAPEADEVPSPVPPYSELIFP